MSLTKKVYLTISGYDIKLSDNLTFYQKDQLKLIFYINEYGIDYENNATTRALMPVNPLNAILFIENPDGVDSVSSAKIEDNAVTFYLDSTHTQYVGISRMQLRLFDQDGCAITLPHFTFEIRENIYGSGDVRFQNVVMVDQTGTVILTEDNDMLDVGDVLTMGTEVAYPQVTKTIKELPIKHGLDGTEKLIVEDDEATKQAPLGTIVDEIKQNSQEKIREIESELAQTNAQLSDNKFRLNDLINGNQLSFDKKIGVHYFWADDNYSGVYAAQFQKIKETGFNYVRVLINWNRIYVGENQPFDFSFYDDYFNELTKNGLKPLIYMWGHPTNYEYDAFINGFPNFVETVVRRYQGICDVWEIYNEPNLNWGYGMGYSSTQRAIDFAKLTIDSAKIIRRLVPHAYIIGVALGNSNDYYTEKDNSYQWQNYLELVCKEGILDYVDAISVHPYRLNSTPEGYITESHPLAKAIIDKYAHKHIPIVCTEMGYSTAVRTGSGVVNINQEQQANYLMRSLLIFDLLNYPLFIAFQWMCGTDTANVEHGFGMIDSDHQTYRPAQKLIKTFIYELSGYYFKSRLFSSSDTFILEYENNEGKTKFVYWSTEEKTVNILGTNYTATEKPQIVSIQKSNLRTTDDNSFSFTSNPTEQLKSLINSYGLGVITKQDVNTCDELMENGWFYVYKVDGLPSGVNHGIINTIGKHTWNKSFFQICYDVESGRMYQRYKKFSADVSEWREIYTSNQFKYYYDDFTPSSGSGWIRVDMDWTPNGQKKVNVRGYISGDIEYGTTLATVRAGYAPKSWIPGSIQHSTFDKSPNFGVDINQDGKIVVRKLSSAPNLNNGENLYFNISYITTR